MKRSIILIALCISATISLTAQSQQKENYIEVSTRAEKQVTPDEIYLQIVLDEALSKGKFSIKKQEDEMIKALKSQNINMKEDLTVEDMSSDLQKFIFKKDDIYATKTYILKVTSASAAANALNSLNSVNISNVSLQRTAISTQLQKATKDELLIQAAKQAKENAEILATAVGSKAGSAIFIQNFYSFSQPYGNFAVRGKLMGAANLEMSDSVIQTVEVSKVPVSVNVTCRFEILN